jgi:hypothetical protein
LKSRLEDSPISPQGSLAQKKIEESAKEGQKGSDKCGKEEINEDLGVKGNEDLSLKEVQKLEEAVKKGEFSWSNLFSGFSRSRKEDRKQEKEEKEEESRK